MYTAYTKLDIPVNQNNAKNTNTHRD